jgi:glycopeptide antibiotics resistance protein
LFGVTIEYTYLLAGILFFKNVSPPELFSPTRSYFRSVDLIPFSQIYGYVTGAIDVSPRFEMTINVLAFIPMGIIIMLFKKEKSISASLFIVFLISLFAETIQFVIGLGASDITDIIINSLGGLIGISIYKGLAMLVRNEDALRSVVILSSSFIGLLLFVVLRWFLLFRIV